MKKVKFILLLALSLSFSVASIAQQRIVTNPILRGTLNHTDGVATFDSTVVLNGTSLTLGSSNDDTIQLNAKILTNTTFSSAVSAFYFRTSQSATTGDHNNLRARAQATAVGAATGEVRAIYAQGITNASLFGGTVTGVQANFIAKNLSTTVTGRAIFAEAETEATPTALTNLFTAHFRTKAHLTPSGDYDILLLENEQLSSGFAADTYLRMKSTTWSAASATYAIDMNGIAALTTADMRGHNGEILSNVTDGVWDVAAANFRASTNNFADATAVAGTGDVITIDFIPNLTVVIGTEFSFIAEAANTTNATINVDGAGAVALEEYNGAQSALDANDIRSAQVVRVQWNGTQYVMMSPSGN